MMPSWRLAAKCSGDSGFQDAHYVQTRINGVTVAKAFASKETCMARGLRLGALVLFIFIAPQSGYAQIAPGVQQSAAHTASITGSVTQSNGRPVGGAEVRLQDGVTLATRSNDRGVFFFNSVPWGTYRIVATSEYGRVSRDNIAINGDINVAIQYEPGSTLKTIANVSTAATGAHINVTSSSISSVTPSDYAFQGNATWTNMFAQIPGVAVSGYSSGGGAFAGTMRAAPQMPVVLSLNGALPYQTSTTLDGMPLQGVSSNSFIEETGGGLDLSNLPINAFDTADVVRGAGANAPSIVDSIGGSFVLHPPGAVSANHFEFSVSNDPFGGIVSNARAAMHFGRLSATLLYGVNNSPGPLGTSTVISGLPMTPATINGNPVAAPISSINFNKNGIVNCFCYGTSTLLIGGIPQSTAWSQHSGAVSLSYEVAPSVTAQVFYAGTTSRQNYVEGYIPIEFAPAAATPAYNGRIAPSPSGEPTYTFLTQENAPLIVSQASSLLEEKLTASTGRGVLRLAALQYNSFNTGNGQLSYPDGAYKIWGTANIGTTPPGTPTAFNGTTAQLTFPNISTQEAWWSNNRDLLFSYATQIGTASSAGISYITSYYNAPYSDALLLGGTPLIQLTQSPAASATTDETRVHFESEISQRLSLGLSWYFATGAFHVPVPSKPTQWTDSIFRYNAPRFGAVWRPTPDLAIRASAGGGFALPALPNLTGYALECNAGECTETTANLNLKPEQSFGFDVGADARLHRNTVASFDIYRTNLYGQFFIGTTQSTLNNQPLFINQYGNLGTSRMEGLNLDIKRDVPSGYYWRGTLGLTRAYVMSLPNGFYNNGFCPTTPCTNQTVVPGPNFISNTYAATVPYSNASAMLGYRWMPGKYVDLSATLYGNNNIYNTPKAFTVLDLHAGYSFTKNVSLLLTFSNITGAYSDAIENLGNVGYLTPVVPGATGFYPGVMLVQPYGPRSAIVTAQFKY
jgi:TonB dependent receptor/Carboxypeptidase regulatory-like domain/TonB-dependent Receptor Plug Domain